MNMRVTIVREDNLVIIDGEPRRVDLSGMPNTIHAVQFDGRQGEIEFRKREGVKPPPEKIANLDQFKKYIDAWDKAPRLGAPEETSDEG